MKWFRFYHDAIDHPKVQRLPGDLFKFWVNMMCLASRSDDRGLVILDVESIAFATRTTDDEARVMIDELIRRNLLDECVEGLTIHNWESRQFKSDNVAERVAKHRQTVTGNNDVTLHVTEKPSVNTDTDTELDTERERATKSDPPPQPPVETPPKPVRAKRMTTLPDDFGISEGVRAWAIKHGYTDLQLAEQLERFTTYAIANGKRYADWDAAFRGWVTKSKDWGQLSPGSNGGRTTSNGKVAREDEFARWRRERTGVVQVDDTNVIETHGRTQ